MIPKSKVSSADGVVKEKLKRKLVRLLAKHAPATMETNQKSQQENKSADKKSANKREKGSKGKID